MNGKRLCIRSIFVHLNLKLDLKIWTYLVTMSLFPVKISEIVVPAPEREIVVETEPLQFSSGMCCVKLSLTFLLEHYQQV